MTDFDIMVKNPVKSRVLWHLVHVCKLVYRQKKQQIYTRAAQLIVKIIKYHYFCYKHSNYQRWTGIKVYSEKE